MEGDYPVQELIGKECANRCGTILTADNIGRMTPKGKSEGPEGVCTNCAPRGASIPPGMLGPT